MIVAKNVAKQESLNEGYRVGKMLHLVDNRNEPIVNYVKIQAVYLLAH